MSEFCESRDDNEGIATIRSATFFDTADAGAIGHKEELLGRVVPVSQGEHGY
jgi:hypothetical protein